MGTVLAALGRYFTYAWGPGSVDSGRGVWDFGVVFERGVGELMLPKVLRQENVGTVLTY